MLLLLALQIGLAGRFDSTGVFLSLRDTTPLAAGTPVTLVRPPLTGSEAPTQVLRASIAAGGQHCPLPLDATGTSCYALTVTAAPEAGQPYLALVGVTGAWQSTPQAAMMDIDGDRKMETLRACVAADGVRFTVWRRGRGQAERLWAGTFPLPPNQAPTCTATETDP